jgi:hypothetical protein
MDQHQFNPAQLEDIKTLTSEWFTMEQQFADRVAALDALNNLMLTKQPEEIGATNLDTTLLEQHSKQVSKGDRSSKLSKAHQTWMTAVWEDSSMGPDRLKQGWKLAASGAAAAADDEEIQVRAKVKVNCPITRKVCIFVCGCL